ncbi:MAG: hypothetical protein KJZ78_21690, partial [Bryobacteraceae bacterium]|nr:hypothetical protein [Bryobacteraceae bacterium]
MQHVAERQSKPATQSLELSHPPPSGTGSARQTPPTQIPEQQCALFGQLLPFGLQQTSPWQTAPGQHVPPAPQLVLLGLQHAPPTQVPEQQSACAAHVPGTSLQHRPLRQSSPLAQSPVSSPGPCTGTGAAAQTPPTQMSEQQSPLEAHDPPAGRQQEAFWHVQPGQQGFTASQKVLTGLQQAPLAQAPEQQS